MWLGIAILLAAVYVVLTCLAWSNLIAKSGRSTKWLVAPMAPVVTVILTYVILFLQKANILTPFHNLRFDTAALVSGLASVIVTGHISFPLHGVTSIMLIVDMVAIAGSWLGFVAFATSAWPTSYGESSSRPRSNAAESVPRPATPTPSATKITTPAASYVAPVAPTISSRGAVDNRRRIYCPWCAESIPGNRALGHDCGPRDRPEVYCRFCGKEFPGGTTVCPTCDAAS